MIPLNVVFKVWRTVLRWIDRRVEPDIMSAHVNKGSYEYFDSEEAYRDRSPLDDVVGDRTPADE